MKDTYGRGKVKYWQWTDGRQRSGYKIFYMWNWLFDFLLIKYPTNSYIKPHRDPVPSPKRHHRINITLWRPKKGGVFHCDSSHIVMKFPRFTWFRPDIGTHSVSKITEGQRWVLSIGWVLGGRFKN